jgi:hypothetical protein
MSESGMTVIAIANEVVLVKQILDACWQQRSELGVGLRRAARLQVGETIESGRVH